MSLEIFNIKGQKVKTLLNEYLQEGEHSVLWNGTNNQNKTVGAGIYFYRLTTPDASLTRKMLLLK
jgi:flagellar hook assembly protein FlgD